MGKSIWWKSLALLLLGGGLASRVASLEQSVWAVPADFQDDERLIEGMDRGIQGDYAGAIAIFSSLIQQYPTYAEAYFNRGFAKAKLQDYTGAIADYTLAIQYNTQFAEAYHQRGILWTKQGSRQKARQDWQKAAQLYQQQDNTTAYQEIQYKLRALTP